jgi:hypothetical protein
MEDLVKKLLEIKALIKAIKASQPNATLPSIPPIKPIRPPSMLTAPKPAKIPGPGPDSKKDPKKVAQQIKDGSMSTKTQKVMLKFDKNGQWSLEKADPDFKIPKKIEYNRPWVNPADPNIVHADYHGFGGEMNNVHPGQKDLIHGLNISAGEPTGEQSATEGNKFIKNPLSGKEMILKAASKAEGGFKSSKQDEDMKRFYQDRLGLLSPDGLNAARREVLFHNVAHGLGLGKFVPATAGFTKMSNDPDPKKRVMDDFSVQEKVDGFKPKSIFDNSVENGVNAGQYAQHYHDTIKTLHDSGDLHKLAILDSLMGNEDRHHGNYLLDPKRQHIHLIDAGRSLDYNRNEGFRIPHYLKYAQDHSISDKIHPKALEWLNNLNEKDVSDMLEKYVEPDSKFKNHFLTRLANIKTLLNSQTGRRLSKDLKNVGEWKEVRDPVSSEAPTGHFAASRNPPSDLKKGAPQSTESYGSI